MKNAIIALVLVFGFVSSSYAGDCANGICTVAVRPVRKVVNITKEIVVAPVRAVGVVVAAPVRAVTVIAAPKSCTETVASVDACNCGSTSTKEVVKYQPLRRRLVNRSTSVTR
jgi:hypothetical protein